MFWSIFWLYFINGWGLYFRDLEKQFRMRAKIWNIGERTLSLQIIGGYDRPSFLTLPIYNFHISMLASPQRSAIAFLYIFRLVLVYGFPVCKLRTSEMIFGRYTCDSFEVCKYTAIQFSCGWNNALNIHVFSKRHNILDECKVRKSACDLWITFQWP